MELSRAWNHLPSIYETPHSILAPEKEKETLLMIKNNFLFLWEEKEIGGKLYLRDDVTLNPKLVYSRGLESRDEAVGRCLPSVENQSEQTPPRALASPDHGLGKSSRHQAPHLLGQAYLPSLLPRLESSF